MRDPAGVQALEVVSRYLGKPVKPVMVPDSHLNAAINIAYQQRTGQTEQLLETLDEESKAVIDEVKQLEGREDLLDIDTRAPVIKLVNLLLFDAVKENASDIHIQPKEDKIVVRRATKKPPEDGSPLEALKAGEGI